MAQFPRQVYPAAFRRQGGARLYRERQRRATAARRWSRSPKSLRTWGRRARTGNLRAVGVGCMRGGTRGVATWHRRHTRNRAGGNRMPPAQHSWRSLLTTYLISAVNRLAYANVEWVI